MAYGHILKDELLEAAPSGCFNLHASLLPKYRGASPIETALAAGGKGNRGNSNASGSPDGCWSHCRFGNCIHFNVGYWF